MACCCWDGIFMGDYFHPQMSPHFTKMCLCLQLCRCVYVYIRSECECWQRCLCSASVCFCFERACICVYAFVTLCACPQPPVTFLSLQSSTQDRRYLGHCETPHPRWDEKQRETDSERNNEINGPHEVMTAGCPHYLMDDKCSVPMSISVPAAHLCQYKTSKTEKFAFWL